MTNINHLKDVLRGKTIKVTPRIDLKLREGGALRKRRESVIHVFLVPLARTKFSHVRFIEMVDDVMGDTFVLKFSIEAKQMNQITRPS